MRRGVPLPPERSVCEQMGVSRVTRAGPRHARRPGPRRAFPRARLVRQRHADRRAAERPPGLEEIAALRGLRAGSRVWLAQSATPRSTRPTVRDGARGAHLRAAPHAPARRRAGRGRPRADPARGVPALTDTDFEQHSLYQTLEATASREPLRLRRAGRRRGRGARAEVGGPADAAAARRRHHLRPDQPPDRAQPSPFRRRALRFRATLYRRPDMHGTRSQTGGTQ